MAVDVKWAPGHRCEVAPLCGAPVGGYRTCGAGCKHVEAYCQACGGDARAREQMALHVVLVHTAPRPESPPAHVPVERYAEGDVVWSWSADAGWKLLP